jgi:hypothetical protein
MAGTVLRKINSPYFEDISVTETSDNTPLCTNKLTKKEVL